MTDSMSDTLQEREATELAKNNSISITSTLDELSASETDACIYIYCPKEDEAKIAQVLKRHPEINAQVNNYALRDFKSKTLCHFKSSHLNPEQQAFLVAATELGAWVEPLVSYFDRSLGYTETELLHSGYFLHQKAFSILSNRKNSWQKRFIDLLFVFMLSWVAIPVGLITALLIKLESPGPVFFKQRRTGQYNEEFEVIKFRSMRNDAEKNGAQWATKNDARVTKVGCFIRKTRIDELPQLINVLKGEMSMVGPRPEREVFISELEKAIPYYRFRHAVKPGVTGLAQVKYPYGASVEDAIWKHKYDIYYIKHQNWMMEVKILFLTVKTVLFGMGR
ncbi:sugar transferase [Vibrio parahaemolyticus]|uniref:sugar transferase n=1 Tax=Vibrio parahaemolyticus TaxID=670 RepID=UPI00084ADB32|nr:sugar transferase [Vibrio parahaemolyticus]EHU4838719.1 sugar transferase [Vibrio parahaemolyticus]EHU5159570.1 sugar transferase [Vibrio parahaemolyticus]EIZ1341955.1 sugar transferase [Vibrio parahaemolyticus]EJF4091815.1 sugar transferase [Vibrio parahaemolyticus]EJG0303298.1 sugar transferase [Vibrio parahaemolyticus]